MRAASFRPLRLLLIFTLIVHAFACATQSEQTVSDVNFNTLTDERFSLHYAYAGDRQKTGVLFIHGTPGNWSAFESYLTDRDLRKDFLLVSVDRIGWGLSTDHKQANNFSFESQADAITKLIKHYANKKWIIVGHSLGASIAPQILLDNPNSIASIVLLAGTLDPELGKPRWYNRLASTALVKWFIPKKLHHSNNEIMQLKSDLTRMHEEIMQTTLAAQLIVIQGRRDKLVSPQNTQFIAEYWRSQFNNIAIIELAQEGHFLPWNQSELVTRKIVELGKRLN